MECVNLDEPFSLQIQRLQVDFKVKLRIFIFRTLGTDGLSKVKGRVRLKATQESTSAGQGAGS